MESRQAVLGVIFSILYLDLICHSNGFRCYTCTYQNSQGDPECLNSPPPKRYLTQCSQHQCWKRCWEYNGVINIQRYCGAASEDRDYCQQTSFQNALTGTLYPATECFCKKDKCNGSPKLIGSSGVITMFVIVTVASSFVGS